jgi:hypothetical protein
MHAYAQGAGWKVWVGLPGNPEFQQAARRDALPVPEYQPAQKIDVPDDWLESLRDAFSPSECSPCAVAPSGIIHLSSG